MQKVVQRTARAVRNKVRKQTRVEERKQAGEAFQRRHERLQNILELNARIRDDRKNRRVDWETGKLAPRRDVGEQEQTYGSISMHTAYLPEKDPERQPEWIPFAAGDRVVILRGRDRGKIGEVQDVEAKRASITVKEMNLVDIQIPEWLRTEQGSQQVLNTIPRSMLVSDVKLVYPLKPSQLQKGEGTGDEPARDMVIDRLVRVKRKYNKHTKEWDRGERMIPGTNLLIPWPAEAEREDRDYDDDTVRMSVEERTFQPSLLRPPMPLTVIDELRSKFSHFRTRHSPEYIEQKQLQQVRAEARKSIVPQIMQTPLQDLAQYRRARQNSIASQPKSLSLDQLAKIGAVIQQQQEEKQQQQQ